MSKKMRLNLDDLKVHSFVTTVIDKEKNKIRGGFSGDDGNPDCEPYNDDDPDATNDACGGGGGTTHLGCCPFTFPVCMNSYPQTCGGWSCGETLCGC